MHRQLHHREAVENERKLKTHQRNRLNSQEELRLTFDFSIVIVEVKVYTFLQENIRN